MKLSHISTELDGMACHSLSTLLCTHRALSAKLWHVYKGWRWLDYWTIDKTEIGLLWSLLILNGVPSLVPCPMHAREKVRVVYINISGPKECHHSLPNLPPPSSLLLLSSLLCNWSRLGGRERRRCPLSISSSTHVAMDHVGSWTVQHNNEMPPNVLLERSQIGTRLIARSSTMDLWKRSGGWDGMV